MNSRKVIFLFAVLICLSINCIAQDSISINGIWNVSEQLPEVYTTDVWQFDDGKFCELKYSDDDSEKMRCGVSGHYLLKDSTLIITIDSYRDQPSPDTITIVFKYEYIDDYFSLEVLEDDSGVMKNMVANTLTMVRYHPEKRMPRL